MASSTTDSSLLSQLQSNDLTNIYTLFSDHLRPFAALLADSNPKKIPSKTLATGADRNSTARSLAKQFLPLLNSTLKLLPKRLKDKPQIDSSAASKLFDTYKLCLNCLDSVAPQLECKPYSVQVQRVRLVHCFEAWGRYSDAENEGFFILESFRSIGSDGKVKLGKVKGAKGRVLPELGKGSVDQEFAVLVVEVTVMMVKCVYMNKSNEENEYKRVLALTEELKPWFRVLDANNYEKLHRVLVTYLYQCTLILVGDLTRFGGNLAHDFCVATFFEFAKSSMNDQIGKFARKLCSSLFSQIENQSPSITKILFCVLDSMAAGCKVGMDSTIIEFLELVCYCANKCRVATLNICGTLAKHLIKLTEDFYQVFSSRIDLIMELYAIGLCISDFPNHVKWGNSATLRVTSLIEFMLDNKDRPRNFTVLLGLLKRQYNIRDNQSILPFSSEYNKFVEFSSDTSRHQQIGNPYLPSYFSALKYFCYPLAEFFNLERREILAEIEDASFSTKLFSIQDALYELCEVFIFIPRTCERERDALDDCKKPVLCIAVAAFTLSFLTKRNIKGNVNFIKHVISSDWIQLHELAYLFSSFNNIGVVFYRNNKMNEASRAMKLCCRAAWTRVLHLCEKIDNKSKAIDTDFEQEPIVGSVTEACAKSAFLLDVLYQCGSHKMHTIIADSLKSWSVAENLVKNLPNPVALVKQWVKIKFKLFKDNDAENSNTTLYSLLSSSMEVSRRTLGILLEQELQAYQERNSLNPKLSHRMQMHIIDILLEDVYITKDRLQKSKILVLKGRALRSLGAEDLHDCIQCLSDAISLMDDMHSETHSSNIEIHDQLAEAYCLRALCTHEIEPNSKQIYQDFRLALDLWLSPQHIDAPDQPNRMSQSTMTLLYYVIDLLSMKGYTEFHSDIYEMMIRLSNWKNVTVEKVVTKLWEYRRLGHALCTSPVNEAFIVTLSRHCGELSRSIKFWLSCLQGSLALRLGFQQNFSFLFPIFSLGSHQLENSFRASITISEVRQAAYDVISSVPVSSGSAFVASHLFYDLCENLVANGQIIEALSCAKEAHRLRSILFQERFIYTIEKQSEVYYEDGEEVHNHCYCIKSFQASTSAATAAWPCDDITYDFEHGIVTPWNVLQCLLESTLQVGTIQEKLGNGSEAETLLKWGKSFSVFHGLSLFTVAYSSILGTLYRKQRLWGLAQKELEGAKQVLDDHGSTISCLKCRLVLEVTIDQQLGDLSRNRYSNIAKESSEEGLVSAEHIYRSALHKLNILEWKNSDHSSSFCAPNYSKPTELPPKNDVEETDMEPKRSRKTKKATKPTMQQRQQPCLKEENNSRMTRSRYRSSQKSSECIPSEVQTGKAKHLKSNHASKSTDEYGAHRGSQSEIKFSGDEIGEDAVCACNSLKVKECRSLNSLLHMKWEFIRRRLLIRLLISIGKCLGLRGEIHKAHELFLETIYVLANKCPFCPINYSFPFSLLLDLIGKDIKGDVFAVERTVLLYDICWFNMESYSSNCIRPDCCGLSRIPIPRIMSWLKLAFVLCREVPILFQKVSKLLAVLYILSTSIKSFSPSPAQYKTISESQWASYFHQASLGNHLNHQLFSRMTVEKNVQNPVDFEGCCPSTSTSISPEILNFLRLAPDSVQDLEGFVLKFFQGLPCATVVCVSILGGPYKRLLSELLSSSSSLVHGCVILSRLNSDGQPVVVLLPMGSILEETTKDEERLCCGFSNEGEENMGKKWHCPWGSTVVDEVAPMFRMILEDNYVSSSSFPREDTNEVRSFWWRQRRRLDQHFGNFLRDLEDSWFGPWKYMFLGDYSDSKLLDSLHKKLADSLKSEYKVTVPENVLKVLIGGINYACQREECVSQIILNNGCCVGEIGDHDCETPKLVSLKTDEVDSLSQSVFKLISETASEIEEKEFANRQPIILVLDFEVQMLPWENLPILRNQEVYRMPSIGSISATLDRWRHLQEKLVPDSGIFPLIDPLDAYFLLNPGGDLSSTEKEFHSWFRDQNMEGITGTTPAIEELSVALKSRDLFIYLGHGSGSQYIPSNEIKKLERCAATLLMGCSSGSLSLNGPYTPQGAPLSYLLAGAPVIVANLWEVTDKDIDRFSKAMLDAWLRERSNASRGGVCDQCELLSNKFKSLTLKGNGRSKISKKKISESCDFNSIEGRLYCKHRQKIGSFMHQARNACLLPYLIGAAPVCYGVPTGIKKKEKFSE